EFATVGAVVQGLPLFSVGLAGIWVSMGGLGNKWGLRLVGALFFAMALAVVAGLIVFSTDVPIALRATSGGARPGIGQPAWKSLLLGVMFSVSYVISGVLALKQARGSL